VSTGLAAVVTNATGASAVGLSYRHRATQRAFNPYI
jgi:hypothetical protein